MPTLRRLAATGAVARERPVNPTVTWANHTSMVTGVPPAKPGGTPGCRISRPLKMTPCLAGGTPVTNDVWFAQVTVGSKTELNQEIDWSMLFVLFALVCGACGPGKAARLRARGPPPKQISRSVLRASCTGFPIGLRVDAAALGDKSHDGKRCRRAAALGTAVGGLLLSFVVSLGSRMYQRTSGFGCSLLPWGYRVAGLQHRYGGSNRSDGATFSGGLFIGCLFSHAEFRRLRPAASRLTGFYLTIAFGGAAGAIFVGLMAPRLFWESTSFHSRCVSPLCSRWRWCGTAALWAIRLFGSALPLHGRRRHRECPCLPAEFAHPAPQFLRFAASCTISARGSGTNPTLSHGTIQHGAQFLWPARRMTPITYYGPDSGIGILLRECFPFRSGWRRRLGHGNYRAYGQPGDTFVLQINSQVIEIAQSLFFFYTRDAGACGDSRRRCPSLAPARIHSAL